MRRITVLPASKADIHDVCVNLRPSDRQEVLDLAVASGRWSEGWDFATQMMEEEAESWALWLEDMPIGIGGFNDIMPGVCGIWFLGTSEADANIISVTKVCRRFVQMGLSRGKHLVNLAPLNQPNRLKWLENVGFDIRFDKANDPFQGFVPFEAIPTAPQG